MPACRNSPFTLLARLALAGAMLVLSMFGAIAESRADPVRIEALRVAGDASRARIVIESAANPEFRWFLLGAPHRMVLEFDGVEYRHDAGEAQPRGLVAQLNVQDAGGTKSRLIVTGAGAFVVEAVDVLENEDGSGHRMVIDLVAGPDAAFQQALGEQIATTSSAPSPTSTASDRFTIVVDPGHGGVDGGARGVTAIEEKTITLAFALELRRALEATGRYDVHLTRDRDLFLRLDERVALARRHEADLFVSIHADAIRHDEVRGATVYTLSETPSDAASAAKAIRENLADQIAGYATGERADEVSDILTDLVRRETDGFSLSFAESLVDELSGRISMIRNPHRFAGFQVLKAPDVPSVLVELGYMSNPLDEAQLRDVAWRERAAGGIVEAIGRFADAHGRIGG